MKTLLKSYKKNRFLRHQRLLKKRRAEYEQAKLHPSRLAVWCTKCNHNMNKGLSYALKLIFHANENPISFSNMLRDWISYIIKSKYYLFVLCTFLLLFLPVSWKENMAMSSSDWWLNICGVAFFLHTNLVEWVINVLAVSILMPLCSYLCLGKNSKTKILSLWILFILGGYIADLIMCGIFSYLHLYYSVVGSSGGCCVLLGTYVALYIYRFGKNYNVGHKVKMYHKFLLFMAFALIYECYLDDSSLSHFVLNPALIVHQVGAILGIVSVVITWIFMQFSRHSDTI